MKTTLSSLTLLLLLGFADSPIANACPLVTDSDSDTKPAPQPAPGEVDQLSVPSALTGPSETSEPAREGGQALYRFLGATMFAASAGDLATTEWGLTRSGVYEANPLVANRNVRVTAHVVVPTLVWWTTNKMRQNGHHKAALWIRIGVTAAYGYAIMHNLRTANAAVPIR